MSRALSARTGSRRLLVRATSLFLLGAPAALSAEPSCARPSAEARRWPSPLDRLVTLHSRDLALRDALDRLATAARLRLSYSSELLTLDRRVCVAYDSICRSITAMISRTSFVSVLAITGTTRP